MAAINPLTLKKDGKTFHISGRGKPYQESGDHKTCKTCQVSKPLDSFWKSASAKKGVARASYCKDCARERSRIAQKKYQDKLRGIV